MGFDLLLLHYVNKIRIMGALNHINNNMKNILKTLAVASIFISNLAVSAPEVEFPEITGLGFPIDTTIKLNGTGLDNLYLLKIGNDWVIGSPNSSMVIKGEIIDLKKRVAVTNEFKKPYTKAVIDSFPEEMKVSYKPKGETVATINVLTDTSCPFCQKLHKEIPELNAAGVEVKYIPFVRGFTNGRGYKPMLSVWCDEGENRKDALDLVMIDGEHDGGKCLTQALSIGYKIANDVGANGTPAIYTESGFAIEGYVPAKKLIKMLLQK